ncbi:DUF5906 domain-containing protein [Ochrobactrum sp. MC-1LL]|uniref:DUF5906 domain-containing protein n=1 Tax=Ochrobactrum sp. MC-1LL TaxID=2735351 RepID=UPI00143843B5|nr:DUF5906 domain-containing protein [Ochrobactrum sp. MC-1LL]NKE75029.1 hypothetical protein [Ochrobactrum sp. MC-1LL]
MTRILDKKITAFNDANPDLHYTAGQKRHVWRDSSEYHSETDKPVLTVSISNTGDVSVRGAMWDQFELTKEDRKSIKAEWSDYQKTLPKLLSAEKEAHLASFGSEHEQFNNPDNRIWLKDHKGHIFGVEKRIETKDGKIYPKLFHYEKTPDKGDSFWSYDWPDPMPFHYASTATGEILFYVFEGPRKAEHAHKIVTGQIDHPWFDEMTYGGNVIPCCIAIAGTNTIASMDFSVINRAGNRIVYFADNDAAGLSAYQDFAKRIDKANLSLVRPDDSFKTSWDIVDDVPVKDGKPIPMSDVLQKFGDWCTIQTGEKSYELTQPAINELFYVGGLDVFGKRSDPTRLMTPEAFNRDMSVQSHAAARISDRVMEKLACKFDELAFDPREKETFRRDGRNVLNSYRPSTIKPMKGDERPWLEFMEQLIPDVEERRHLLRWIATLYARPETRMIFAPLLISKAQGTGKGTLKRILTELVGRHNVSYPNETNVMSEFNGWLAQRRLICVDEVYQGRSWKLANKLKELITEGTVSLRLMRRDPFEIDNWAHFYLMSNSFEAIRIDNADRRLFVPEVTETRWPDEKWKTFNHWLEKENGYSIIANWALEFGDYVSSGERAPMTTAKMDMIQESENPVKRAARELLESLLEKDDDGNFKRKGCVLGANELLLILPRDERGEKAQYVKERDIRAIARGLGWIDPASHPDFKGKIGDWRNTMRDRKMEIEKQYPLIHPSLRDVVFKLLNDEAKPGTLLDSFYVPIEEAVRLTDNVEDEVKPELRLVS